MTRSSAPVDAPAADVWEGLVTTALLGTDRRTPPGTAPGPDAPAALLFASLSHKTSDYRAMVEQLRVSCTELREV
ncbi:hypothetical protein ABZ281_26815, partial [Streptomyces sp. NPDC006265]|uniref:hypothetical protein n=1 Tax=Streptomyces sp. NPDC006265 TaxID=3156740 RepID=UPI0033A88DC6